MIVVLQVEIFPQASVTVHVIVDRPTVYTPLAFVPVPLDDVAPVITKLTVIAPQLSVADNGGMV